MNEDSCVRLLDLYARAQEALRHDRLDEATPLITEAGTLLDPGTPAEGDPAALRSLAGQVAVAHAAVLEALSAARQRLLAAAQRELRSGGDSARAYSATDDRPDARFIDRTS